MVSKSCALTKDIKSFLDDGCKGLRTKDIKSETGDGWTKQGTFLFRPFLVKQE